MQFWQGVAPITRIWKKCKLSKHVVRFILCKHIWWRYRECSPIAEFGRHAHSIPRLFSASLKLTQLWHKGLLPDVFRNTFLYAGDVHNYNSRYATNKNLCKPRVRTNTGKQMILLKAITQAFHNTLKNWVSTIFPKKKKKSLFMYTLNLNLGRDSLMRYDDGQ